MPVPRAPRGSPSWLLAWGLASSVLLAAPSVRALDVGTGSDLTSVEVHAFASQGFILSKDNNYLSTDSTHGSFQFSEVGINFTKSLTDKLRMGMQLFAEDLGPSGDYKIRADWFYMDYRWRDWLGFRAGRVKIPFGLYNESSDIDQARVAVLLPQSVYPIENTNYLLAQTGAELYGYLKSRSVGALEYRAYGGTIYLDLNTPSGSPETINSLNVPYVAGGRLMWETPVEGLRVGGSLQTLRLDASITAGTQTATLQAPVVLWVGSVEYAAGDLLLAAEYSRWIINEKTDNPALIPVGPTVVSEHSYALAAYRATRWLQPGVYYALQFPNIDQRQGRANYQHDVATTLRFDINEHWLFKLEGHYMFGTAGVDSTINGNTPLDQLSKSWGVLLVKTTAYF
jgi:hypothetical protein